MYKDKCTRVMENRAEQYENRERCPLDGDIPVLQFVNTKKYRGTPQEKDYLKNYDDFLNWAYDSKVIEQAAFKKLCFESYCEVTYASKIFDQVISMRESLYALIICLMEEIAPYHQQLNLFNLVNDEANKHRRLDMNGDGMWEVWIKPEEEIAFPLWKIVKQATQFLMLVNGKQVKKCGCGNLFPDRSKNNTRRWCKRLTCGSRYWSKEYSQRKKVVNG
jgi:predicted RNA-binding Zn ribbon-like protein